MQIPNQFDVVPACDLPKESKKYFVITDKTGLAIFDYSLVSGFYSLDPEQYNVKVTHWLRAIPATPTASVEERAKEYAEPYKKFTSYLIDARKVIQAAYLAGAAEGKGAEGGFAEWAQENDWKWYKDVKYWEKNFRKGYKNKFVQKTTASLMAEYQQYLLNNK